MFTISTCMIVKNEESSLRRILDCVKQFSDEIIIVDTGSTDNTINIAKDYTDKIYHFEWCNNFALARNFSLSHATKDYIMWLDADDYISKENINKILKLKQINQDTDMYMFKYVMGFDGKNYTFDFFRERLFRNNKGYHFQGFIHEAIPPCGKIQYLNIQIEHKKQKNSDPKRNLKIYNNVLKLGVVFSARDQYYYGRELFYNGYYNKCIKTLKKYLLLNDTYTPNITGAYTIIADCYSSTGDYESSKKILIKYISLYTPNSEICCKLANAFENTQNEKLAIFWYKVALSCSNTEGFINHDYEKFIPFVALTKLLYKTNKNEAKEYHLKAKKIKPHHPSIIFNNQFF